MLPATRPIRRPELRKLVPLADTTIYEMERRGEFPRRYPLTRRCVVWDLAEVQAWLADRKQQADQDGDDADHHEQLHQREGFVLAVHWHSFSLTAIVPVRKTPKGAHS